MWPKRNRQNARARLAALAPASAASRVTEQSAHSAFTSPLAQRGDMDSFAEQEPERRWHVRWDARSRKAISFVLAGLLLVVAWWWWSGRPNETVLSPDAPEMVMTEGAPVTTQSTGDGAATTALSVVVVHVVGKVAEPGIVELPAGSRVIDAIDAVGGATKAKALESVNLARVVVDGEQIVVGESTQAPGADKVSINSADAGALEQLPGVGPVIAERIVQWRTDNGPFRSVEELAEISGIGPSMIERIADQVRM